MFKWLIIFSVFNGDIRRSILKSHCIYQIIQNINIPKSFGQLTKLTFFGVDRNRLSGTIPSSMFNLSSLTTFAIAIKQIQGHLPLDIGITLPNIERLNFAHNQFIGSIPVSISNASNLEILALNKNKLSGEVPSLEKLNRISFFSITLNNLGSGGPNDLGFLYSLTNATNLTFLAINDNNFRGELPKCIGNLSTIEFSVFNYKISGKIPTEIGNLINLENLTNNKLSDNIPYETRKLQKLQILVLNTNKFSGSIPSSLGNLTVLTHLYLYDNNLQGNIPLSLSKCRNLFTLNLHNNDLNGLISP